MKPADTSDREIVLSRLIDAPQEMVWQAFTDSEQVVHWWGPNGFTTTIHVMEVRPGGMWHLTMHGPDGTNYPNKSIFLEVIKPERIVYKLAGGRESGGGAHFVATWTFEKVGNQTQLTGRLLFDTTEDRDFVAKEYGAVEGGRQTLERLAEYMAKKV